MDEKSKKFLYSYLNNSSPTSFEASGQRIWLDYLKPYSQEWFTDIYGTAVAVINPSASYKVVIEAHADEISWYVNYITKEGLLHITRNGGSDHQIAPSKRVNIHTKKGIVKGVIGWPAIHVRSRTDEPKVEIKNLTIDCGCDSKEEVEKLGIHVGCVVTYEDGLMELNDRYFVGRAIDNRIGGFMIAEVARRLHENNVRLPYALYIVNSVQEEIGLRGAEMIAHRIMPDVAIITDVCHDTQTFLYEKKIEGDLKCGAGPVLSYAPSIQFNLLEMIIQVAEKYNIPFQRLASSRYTGTDTDAFAYAGTGVASALISLPLKYMHTTVEMVHKDDVEKIIQLIYHFLCELPAGHDFRYIK
ncbi:MAG: M42 family metallopeptidase [Flammeovirgaceae bacterium]|nr:M42 family metallopeptidase [Flammeovirgaceae bacterium]MDW8288095.1 M42 family metallopeptidase [Flammeovirgaceae bacterium]